MLVMRTPASLASVHSLESTNASPWVKSQANRHIGASNGPKTEWPLKERTNIRKPADQRESTKRNQGSRGINTQSSSNDHPRPASRANRNSSRYAQAKKRLEDEVQHLHVEHTDTELKIQALVKATALLGNYMREAQGRATELKEKLQDFNQVDAKASVREIEAIQREAWMSSRRSHHLQGEVSFARSSLKEIVEGRPTSALPLAPGRAGARSDRARSIDTHTVTFFTRPPPSPPRRRSTRVVDPLRHSRLVVIDRVRPLQLSSSFAQISDSSSRKLSDSTLVSSSPVALRGPTKGNFKPLSPSIVLAFPAPRATPAKSLPKLDLSQPPRKPSTLCIPPTFVRDRRISGGLVTIFATQQLRTRSQVLADAEGATTDFKRPALPSYALTLLSEFDEVTEPPNDLMELKLTSPSPAATSMVTTAAAVALTSPATERSVKRISKRASFFRKRSVVGSSGPTFSSIAPVSEYIAAPLLNTNAAADVSISSSASADSSMTQTQSHDEKRNVATRLRKKIIDLVR